MGEEENKVQAPHWPQHPHHSGRTGVPGESGSNLTTAERVLYFTVTQERGCGQIPRGKPCLILKLGRKEKEGEGDKAGEISAGTASSQGAAQARYPAQRREAAPPGKEKTFSGSGAGQQQCLKVVKANLPGRLSAALPSCRRPKSPSLTCKEFITPLASTAIFPATDLTPCLNWAMSAVGSTLPKDTLPVKARERRA